MKTYFEIIIENENYQEDLKFLKESFDLGRVIDETIDGKGILKKGTFMQRTTKKSNIPNSLQIEENYEDIDGNKFKIELE